MADEVYLTRKGDEDLTLLAKLSAWKNKDGQLGGI